MYFARPLRTFVCALIALAVPAVYAQATRSNSEVPASKFEVYLGYGYWNPLSSNVNGFRYDTVSDMNAAAGFSYFFTKKLGVTLDANYFNDNRTHVPLVSGICGPDAAGILRCFKDQQVTTVAAGPVYRFPIGRFVPFVHILGGGEQINGPVSNPSRWGWMVEAGGGVDYVLPWFHDHVALRPIQADFQEGQVNYGPLVLPQGIVGGAPEIGAIHLSAGVVVRWGGRDGAERQELACSADPNAVYPGEPVTLSAIARGFGKNPHLDYIWTVPGRRTPHDSAVTVSTAGLEPGDYRVNLEVSNHGHRNSHLTCATGFTVRAYEPPTVSCSASPATALPGQPVQITASARSPQNRTLTYRFDATSGTLKPSGAGAELSTLGAPAGSSISVTCGVTDDLGKSASATTTVAIQAPPPTVVEAAPAAPVAPAAVPEVAKQQPLCTIYFERDRKRPVRADNEAKACLDSVALSKNRETLSKLVLVGTYTPGEGANAAAERSLHAKQYLVDEKGMDAASIQTMVKASNRKSVESVLLPGDAVFEEDGTLEFDPASVRLHGEAYGKKHRRRR